MSTTRFVVPVRRSGCSRVALMPAGLSQYCGADEYSASMARLVAASRPALGLSVVYWLSWVAYLGGVFSLFGAPYMYDVESQWWLALGVMLGSLMLIITVGRVIRRKKLEQLTSAVAAEHALYSAHQPQLSWSLVNWGWRQMAVEIEVTGASQQQLLLLQQQLNAAMQQQQQIINIEQQLAFQQQQHLAVELQHQQQPQPQWVQYPSAPQYPTVLQPAYAPAYGSVFAHPPPPQYVAQLPQPVVPPYAMHAAELNQPLIRY